MLDSQIPCALKYVNSPRGPSLWLILSGDPACRVQAGMLTSYLFLLSLTSCDFSTVTLSLGAILS